MILICGFHISLYFLHNIIIFNGAQHAADACLTNDGETISDRTGPKWQVMTDAPAPPRWSSSRSWRPEAERPLLATTEDPATPRWSSSRSWRPEAEDFDVVIISHQPCGSSVATPSLALATHPSQSSSMTGGALALLSLKRS